MSVTMSILLFVLSAFYLFYFSCEFLEHFLKEFHLYVSILFLFFSLYFCTVFAMFLHIHFLVVTLDITLRIYNLVYWHQYSTSLRDV